MEDIYPDQLKQRLENQEKLNMVDVREEWENEENNIGGINIPLGSLPHRLDELEHLKDQELIVFCRTGNRSGNAKKYLETQGFSKVRNLMEGIVGYMEL
ncbi:MAG: rhodanese-like domain-containing protein [Bacteroidetes bacterium]|nr:rhodanese-like domain-containing protein [Bacteroidota bacterium]MCZ6898936.1 rhodanese-like domain-containing protein [Bacteroidota bacterium]